MEKDEIKPFMPLPPPEFTGGSGALAEIGKAEFFSSGRGAMLRALELCGAPKELWLPNYFCPNLTKLAASKYRVRRYDDMPSESEPRFETLSPKAGDAVVAVNFFGLRGGSAWRQWRAQNPDVALIEDHSHAPFSRWAREGLADFSFASLRKTLPIPDGAYLRASAHAPKSFFARGSDMPAFAAEALAAAALQNSPRESEDLYYAAEAKLNAVRAPSRISKYSIRALEMLDIKKMAARRFENMKIFCGALGDSSEFEILNFARGAKPEAFDVYYPALKFSSAKLRDRVYAGLRERGIFAAIYWGSMRGAGACAAAVEESAKMFVIPLDFRHSAQTAREAARIFREVLFACR